MSVNKSLQMLTKRTARRTKRSKEIAQEDDLPLDEFEGGESD